MAIQYLVEAPVDCGRRLLPVYIDGVAKTNPDRPFISVARTTNAADGYVDVSFKTFATAVNRCAWTLEEQIGRSQSYTPVLYIGPLDIRYLIVLIAAAKTGHVVFFTSHRNSLKAHISLLETIKCEIVLEPERAPTVLNQILAARPMKRLPLASLEFFLDPISADAVKEYPFEGSFAELKDKPLVILHTSGSTGIPKPVPVTNGVFASQDAQQLIPYLGGKPTWVDKVRGNRVFIGLPVFHAGCLAKLAYSIWGGSTVLLPPAGPLSAEVVDTVFTHGNVDGALIAPSLIVDIYRNPAYLTNMLQRLNFLGYVGGTLSKPVGDAIASHIELITMFGSTETLSYPIEINDHREDWEYISYSTVLGHHYHPVDDTHCEMVMTRNPEFEIYQAVFSTFPEKNEYGTKDLYEAHRSRQGLWRFRLRSDDIICFSNAEKLNPITMEGYIASHPKVQSAIIGGHGQFQACLLLEPMEYPTTPEETDRFIDDVWTTIVEANKDCPAHGRVMRDFVMLTDPARPIPRAGKGTVQRASVYSLYETEFREIYAQCDEPEETIPVVTSESVDGSIDETHSKASVAESSPTLSGMTTNDIEAYVEQCLRQQLPRLLSEYMNQVLGNAMGQMAANLLQQPKVSFTSESYKQSPQEQHISGLVNGHLSANTFTNGYMTPDSSVDGHAAPTSYVTVKVSAKEHEEPHTNPNNTSTDALTTKRDPSYFRDVLNRVLLETTYLSGLTDQANLFDCGLDSVQVPVLVKNINKTLGGMDIADGPIVASTIYNNPSVNQLVQALGGS